MRSMILGCRVAALAAAGGLAVTLVSATLAPPAGAVGTASFDGTRVLYSDPDQRDNNLDVTLRDDADGPRVTFLDYEPATIAGPGCVVGFVATECRGSRLPDDVTVFAGPGNDTVELSSSDRIGPTRANVFGGPGNDEIGKLQTVATIDGGQGDDVVVPDDRSFSTPVPSASPGDLVRGGDGDDLVDYSLSRDGVTVSLDGVADDGRTGFGEGDNVLPDVENLIGSSWDDRLVGSDAANQIAGGAGDDIILGARGQDALTGGGGNDVIDARDGEVDRVNCGEGADTAYVDAVDVVAVGNGDDCEQVVRSASPVGSKTLKLRGSSIATKVSCRGSRRTCRGTVVLTTVRGGTSFTMGKARYSVRRGKVATVRVKASAKAVRVLRKNRSTPATLVVKPSRGVVTRTPVTIRR